MITDVAIGVVIAWFAINALKLVFSAICDIFDL